MVITELDQVINGYLWNNKGIEFSIGDDSSFINDSNLGTFLEVKFSNTQVKGKITIEKTGKKIAYYNNSYSYNQIKLSNAKFEVKANEDIIINGYKYYNKGDLVGIIITDENGYGYIDNLPLGKYTIQEIASSNGNMLDKKIMKLNLNTKIIYKCYYS